MYYSIFILPNSSDNWETTSPFSTLLGNGMLGFCLSNSISSQLTEYTLISSKLLDVSDIDQSVDIFGGVSKTVQGGFSLKGIGGVASSSDFTFSIDKFNVNVLLLLRRQIYVTVGYGNSILDINAVGSNTVFGGKIKKIKPNKNKLTITVCGLLATLKDREVGSLTNFSSEVYKGKIYPIVYGDFTDKDAIVDVVLDNNLRNNPKIVLGQHPMNSITNVGIWDEDTNTRINYNNESVDGLNIVDNTAIKLTTDKGLVLKTGIDGSETVIEVYDPPTFGTNIRPDAIFDIDVMEPGVTVYRHTPTGDKYKFVEKIGEYYKFTCGGTSPPEGSTLTLVEGAGVGTIIVDGVSDPFETKIIHENSGFTDDNSALSDARPSECVLEIDDEMLLVTASEVQSVDGEYSYTKLVCIRGYKETTAESHLADTPIYVGSSADNVTWNFTHKLYCSSVSNFNNVDMIDQRYPVNLDELTKMNRTGELGDPVSFNMLDLSELFIDLSFPKIGVSANIVEAYLTGFYRTTGTERSFISVFKSGTLLKESYVYFPNRSIDKELYVWAAGLGMLVEYPLDRVPGDEVKLPFYTKNGVNYTISTLSYYSSEATLVRGGYILTYDGHGLTANHSDRAYSLLNNVEQVAGDYYRNTILGDASDFLSEAITLFCYGYNNLSTVNFNIANPGLLLKMEINPLKNKLHVQGIGRGNILTPQGILIDLLDKELSFTDIVDNSNTTDLKQSICISDNIVKFSEVSQSICEQSGLILSESTAGSLQITDINPPEDTSSLETISSSNILLDKNTAAIEEEWTDSDRLMTDLTIAYRYNSAGSFYSKVLTSADIPTISNYLLSALNIIDEQQKATLDLPYIRDEYSAIKLAETIVKYNTTPLKILTVRLTFNYIHLSIGQWVKFNVAEIPDGYVYLIVGKSLDFENGVTIKAIAVPDSTVMYDVPSSTNIYQDSPNTGEELLLI